MLKSALLLAFVGIGWSKPMETCQQQEQCIKTTFTKSAASTCGANEPCQWTVCVQLDLKNGRCVKTSGTVSHTCVKSFTECPPLGWGSVKEGIADGFQECQTGKAGDTLTFVLKDGNNVGTNSEFMKANNTLLLAPADARITCAPSQGLTCTGTGNVYKERIWSITLPSCGVAQPAPVVTPTVDTILVLDASNQDNVVYAKQYATERVKAMKLGDGNRVGVVVYSSASATQMVCPLMSDLQQVLSKIDAITYRAGSPDLDQAIKLAALAFTETTAGKKQVFEVVCTGKSSTSAKTTAASQKAKGVTILAIGAGAAADTGDLQDIATSSDTWMKSDDASAVVSIADAVVGNPPFIKPVETTTTTVLASDTIFVLDVSSALGAGNVENLKQYVKERLSRMDLALGNNKAGIVVYSTAGQTEMLCPLTSDSSLLLGKVAQISLRAGQSNLAEAIKLAGSVFQTATSGRTQVLEVLVAGASSSTDGDVQTAISNVKSKGVHALAIGMGATTDTAQLKTLQTIASEPTADNMVQVQDSTTLITVADTVMGCCPPVITKVTAGDNRDCAAVENRIPKVLNSVDSTGIPACWFNDVKAMLSDYDCQEAGDGCNLLQCNKALPDDVMAKLVACK